MIRTTLLIVSTALLLSGWVWARQQELLNHPHDVQMQVMEGPGCDPSSSSGGAG
jgi:hypothetical protein